MIIQSPPHVYHKMIYLFLITKMAVCLGPCLLMSYGNQIAGLKVVFQTFGETTDYSAKSLSNTKFDGVLGMGYLSLTGFRKISGFNNLPVFNNLLEQHKEFRHVFGFYLNRDFSSAMGGELILGGTNPVHYEDEVGAIIFDVGHQSLRVGYGGEDTPKAEIPTTLGVWEEPADPGGIDCNNITRKHYNIDVTAIQVRKKDMEIVSLMKDGMIDDWDMFERLTEYTYKQRLHALAEHHPILMTECPWNTRLKREKLLELMFEKFNVPAMYICKNAVLAAYANGRSTAMVVDSGATHTSAVPVHDGYVITQGIVKSPLGGDFITMQCRQFFEEKDIELLPACLVASKDVVRERDPPRWTKRPGPQPTSSWLSYMVRELLQDFQMNCLQVSDSPYDEDVANTLPMKHYEFPTGYNDDFGSVRLMIPEALFDPSNVKGVGASILGVGPLVTTSVGMCDMDIRPSLYGSVVVTGGNSCLQGFSERLNRDLGSKTPPSMRLKIISANSSSERRYGAWIGGSILSSLGSFQQMWLSRQEYEESGKLILERCA